MPFVPTTSTCVFTKKDALLFLDLNLHLVFHTTSWKWTLYPSTAFATTIHGATTEPAVSHIIRLVYDFIDRCEIHQVVAYHFRVFRLQFQLCFCVPNTKM